MRIRWDVVIPLCVIALAACAPIGSAPAGDDLLMTAFDPKEWTVANQSANQRQRIMEFVPPGHQITAWTELMTIQTFVKPTPPPDIDGLAASAFEPLSKRCPGRVVWNVVRRWSGTEIEQASVLYEWKVKDCPPEADQHEVARIVYGKSKRDKWIRELSGARIVGGN